jgi:hypothetical protein
MSLTKMPPAVTVDVLALAPWAVHRKIGSYLFCAMLSRVLRQVLPL